ncbi:Imm1 family immunity protein [Nocardia sp. NRRL S-836]
MTSTRGRSPAVAVLPLEKIPEALLEFMATTQRPTCLAWQNSEIIV